MTRFIALEGIDGAGKSIQAKLLVNRLNDEGLKTLEYSYPQYDSFMGKRLGQLLRSDLANKIDTYSMSLWYASDRYLDFRDNLKPHLDSFDVVVFNRYTLSSAIFQGCRSEDPLRTREWIFSLEHDQFGVPQPELYFVLDVEVEEARRRNEGKIDRAYIESGVDTYEANRSLQQMAGAEYRNFCDENENSYLIEGVRHGIARSPKDISDEIYVLFDRHFDGHP